MRSRLCRSDILTAAELIEDTDDDLFQRILWDKKHILRALLPDSGSKLGYDYELRPRSHDRELAPKLSCLTDSNSYCHHFWRQLSLRPFGITTYEYKGGYAVGLLVMRSAAAGGL